MGDPTLLDWALWAALFAVAAVGHMALWLAFVNRVHATALPVWAVRWLTVLGYGSVPLAPVLLLAFGLNLADFSPSVLAGWHPAALFYVGLCWLVSVGPLPWELYRRWSAVPAGIAWTTRSSVHHLHGPPALGWPTRLVLTLPGNQARQLEVNEKTLEIARLDPALDGLRIAHLSDLHFTGRIGLDFFESAISLVGQMAPDLIALTGDLVEKTAYLEWLDALSRLSAPGGVYYVLGNHDLRINVKDIRRKLAAAELIDLGGRWRKVELRGAGLVLAGNELPWIVPAAEMTNVPLDRDGRRPLRVLLSHSPDQIRWAQARDFDLMLAGHNHGGQICLPLVGPLVAPSRYGVRYAGGTYFESPTVMHVSRGLSSELPLRLRCPPEATVLVLRRGRS